MHMDLVKINLRKKYTHHNNSEHTILLQESVKMYVWEREREREEEKIKIQKSSCVCVVVT